MPWTKPQNGPSRVDLAGDVISGRKIFVPNMEMDSAFDVAGNWRSSHGYPLHIMADSLQRRARLFNKRALIAQRMKRMPSIQAKLSRFPNMQFSKMQDLGGCRAILGSVRSVDKLARYYETHPYGCADFVKKYDYIQSPKPDGYRGIHLIYKYQGEHQAGAYKGLRIEIQLRSQLQHAWATAVETIDSFTGQGLKSNIGSDEWKRFFVLMGSVVAVLEDRPLVPNTTLDLEDELRSLCGKLNVPDVFYGLEAGMDLLPTLTKRTGIYILSLDSERKITEAYGFDTTKEADAAYLDMEKENQGKSHIQSVMVSMSSMRRLRDAYPNYFVDTHKFISITEVFRARSEKNNAKRKAEAAR